MNQSTLIKPVNSFSLVKLFKDKAKIQKSWTADQWDSGIETKKIRLSLVGSLMSLSHPLSPIMSSGHIIPGESCNSATCQDSSSSSSLPLTQPQRPGLFGKLPLIQSSKEFTTHLSPQILKDECRKADIICPGQVSFKKPTLIMLVMDHNRHRCPT